MTSFTDNAKKFLSLDDWSQTTKNSWIEYLKSEDRENTNGKRQYLPREVKNIHFSYVETEKVPAPYFISASTNCAIDLGLDPTELNTNKFVNVFSGNEYLPGFNQPIATVYGCHSYGQWFGQLGDGRAMSLGEIIVPDTNERFELQLKGD